MPAARCQPSRPFDIHPEVTDMKFKIILTVAMISTSALFAAGCAHRDEHTRTAGKVVDDASITTKVKAALLAEKDVNSFDIKVETFNGVVQLSGFVESKWQVDKAQQVAMGIHGVQNVKNDLIHKN